MTISTPTKTVKSGKSATISQTWQPVGLDIGNGALKLVTSMGEYRLDSYVTYLETRLSMGANAGYVEYIQGDRDDLVGKQWIGGINAYYHSPKGLSRVTDDKC